MSAPPMTFGPGAGTLGFGKRQGRGLGQGAQSLGTSSLAERGCFVGEAPVRNAANVMGDSLASVRDSKPATVRPEDLPAADKFKEADGSYRYPIDFILQLQPLFKDSPSPDFMKKIEFLSAAERSGPRPFGMLSSRPGGVPDSKQQQAEPSMRDQPTRTVGGFGESENLRDLFNTAEVAQAQALLPHNKNAFSERGGGKEKSELDKFYLIVMGLLNKLTPEKYANLVPKILSPDLDIFETDEKMGKVIEGMFIQAIANPLYVATYAKLAVDITAQEKEKMAQEGREARSTFRKQLISMVQSEYETRREEMQKAEESEDPVLRAELFNKVRKRKLGTMAFVGQLYIKKLLSDKIAHTIVADLLFGKDFAPKQEDDKFYPEEGDLDCLLELFFVIGRQLEDTANEAKSKGNNDPLWKIQQYFIKFDKIITANDADGKKKMYANRIRFRVQDLNDARRKGWPADKRPQKQQATTMAEFEKKEEERQMKKAAGMRDASYQGESSAWGRAAEVNEALGDVGGASRDAGAKKKGGKKGGGGGGDDNWDVAGGGNKAGKKQDVKGQGKKKGPQATAGTYGAIQAPSKGKDAPPVMTKEEKVAAKRAEKEAARLEKERKEQKAAKREEQRRKKEEAQTEKVPEIPEGFFEKVKSRYGECTAESDKEKREEAVKEEYGSLLPKPLLVHQWTKYVVSIKDDGERATLRAFLQELVDAGVISTEDVHKGLGWFASTAVCEQLKEDLPAVYKRLRELVLEHAAPTVNYFDTSRVCRVAFRATKSTLEERGETEYLGSSVTELLDDFWNPLHEKWDMGADAPEDWQGFVLKEILAFNDKTGWLTDEEEAPAIVWQAKRLQKTGIISSERLGQWKADLEAVEEGKEKERADRALEHLQDFFGSL
eukprot:Hpha_TRINITY_DN16425_c0_g1::TRINITY_DN16425_c0_g1_i1::g.159448::m.159448/K03260/EIF4G; translation initiation factor 4G